MKQAIGGGGCGEPPRHLQACGVPVGGSSPPGRRSPTLAEVWPGAGHRRPLCIRRAPLGEKHGGEAAWSVLLLGSGVFRGWRLFRSSGLAPRAGAGPAAPTPTRMPPEGRGPVPRLAAAGPSTHVPALRGRRPRAAGWARARCPWPFDSDSPRTPVRGHPPLARRPRRSGHRGWNRAAPGRRR
jgi:hypothetical protein